MVKYNIVKSMTVALFPGSFDPPTYGHLDIIGRANSIFDQLHVVVAVNKGKSYLFSAEERVAMLRDLASPWRGVRVDTWDSLIADYAERVGATVLVRGVRNALDFSYEFDLALLNRGLAPRLETVFLPADPRHFALSSSAVKELAHFGGDVSAMVPPVVAESLLARARERG